ncbi:pyruvate dehydrogenase E2 component (dihydrolipoamide acetyltransferase) [Nocardioides exalbidus]|uniref:Dihydrolipoamide acetyltransferase component of pyruvate dehydrogenase complex n=2 Tax=Nocardioides exalbidus TaxID=402596 RepID=A0A1H4U635_9ACTN|nr:pyruvate dehydrogenase E2 component (dihydrolipoamide acetyltransferase) [Nocardioides exalbidus]
MPTLIRMPAVAAGATEVVLAEWPVAEKESFASGEGYAVIETDKAVVDLEAESDGVLVRTLVAPGAKVQVGDPIALVAAPGETVDDVEAALAALGFSPAPSGAVPVLVPAPTPADARRVFASPLARRLARDAGLTTDDLVGTGPGGRVVRRDVELAIAARHATPGDAPAAPAAPVVVPTPPTPAAAAPAPTAGTTEVPHTRLRRAVASRLVQSTQEAPHFYVSGTARVDRLLALRAEVADATGTRVSVNDLVVRAVGRAHELVPELNVTWTEDAVVQHSRVDVGIAVATARGLVTPVVTDVTGRSLLDLSAATKDLATRAAGGGLRQHELEGGTVAVSNLGMFGVEEFSAIINPPHSSILAVGAARQEAVVVDGALEVATVMRFVLSVDHRPVDGVVAGRWMQAFLRLVEQPLGMLA